MAELCSAADGQALCWCSLEKPLVKTNQIISCCQGPSGNGKQGDVAYGFILLEARGFPRTKSLQLPLNRCDRSLLFELLLLLLFQTPDDFHGNSIPATPGLVLSSVICCRVTPVHTLQRGAAGPHRCLLHWRGGLKTPLSPSAAQPCEPQGTSCSQAQHRACRQLWGSMWK